MIFVSLDCDENSFKEYFNEMLWYVFFFSECDFKVSCSDLILQFLSIFSLVLVKCMFVWNLLSLYIVISFWFGNINKFLDFNFVRVLKLFYVKVCN